MSGTFQRGFSSLRRDAGVGGIGAFSTLVTLIGLAADIGTPWRDFLGWLVIGAVTLLVLALALRAGSRPPPEGEPPRGMRRLAAAMATYAATASAILGPAWILNRAIGGDSGLLAEAVPAVSEIQETLARRIELLDDAIAVLTEQVEVQTEGIDSLNRTMDLSLAIETMDRLRERRDGSNQGQALAMTTLLSHGFDFVGADFSGVAFRDTVLNGADFTDARLHFIDIRGASLREADLSGTGLRLALGDASTVLAGADLTGSFAPLFEAPGADLRDARFRGATFFGADLREADLRGADFTEASLAFADLSGADLTGADFTGAYLIGTVLTGAVLAEAIFDRTDLLGAVLDPTRLSPEQMAGACRHQVSAQAGTLFLTEQWESDRFSSGYEFDQMNEYDPYFAVAGLDDLSLPLCGTPSDSAVGFDSRSAADMRFALDRDYLAKAGRREAAMVRFDAFRRRLAQAQETGPLFSGQGAYREEWLALMRAATPEPTGPPRIDTDLMLVEILARGLVSPDEVDWRNAMSTRLRLEEAERELTGGETGVTTHWPAFFPEGASLSDLPEEAESLFRDWTLARAAEPRPLLAWQAPNANNAEANVLSLATGYLRDTIEGVTSNNSWPSHRVAQEVEEMVSGKDRTRFVPVRSIVASRMLLAFPAAVGSYRVPLPPGLAPELREVNSDLDIMLEIKQVAAPKSDPDLIVFFVEPVSARLTLNNPKEGAEVLSLEIVALADP